MTAGLNDADLPVAAAVRYDRSMLQAEHAYYIKLGRGGGWAADSIKRGWARIGWKGLPLGQIQAGDWPSIRKTLRTESKTAGAGTMDSNALERFCCSMEGDIWITFHDSKLWWGRLKTGPLLEDATSRYRELVDGWHDRSMKNEFLFANQIPGRISQLQAFRATVCRVRYQDALLRLLSGERSPESLRLESARKALVTETGQAVTNLHWKDFELLVDLVFRQSGWRRVTAVGDTMKAVDMELEDPITRDQYQVQVKSRVTKATVTKCREDFRASGSAFRKFYFVVHSPDDSLRDSFIPDDDFELVLPERLAELVVDGGLTSWLLDKIA